MSQSIVVPELDGAIYPYVLNDQELDEEGIYLFKAIPERLKNFTRIIGNFISLKRKPNAEKKVAIYYFKGAGQSSLTAQGLETVPSLYNLLKRLKAEGYTVKNLPATEKEFEKPADDTGCRIEHLCRRRTFDDFLKNGRPALVGKSEYESWVQDALPEEALCRRRATVRRSAGPLYEYGPGGRTVPGRSPHRSGQRRAAAAAHGRGRRRRLRYRTRRQNRSAPPLHRRLPLGAIRLRSRRDDSLRHTAAWSSRPGNRWRSAATTGPTVWWAPFPTSITTPSATSARA